MLAAGMLACLALAACTPPDAHVPPFAKVPYQAFSRQAVVAIALREWRLFGSRVLEEDIALPARLERAPGLWQRVGEYWWLGLNADAPEVGWTGKHDGHGREFPPSQDGAYAWSAAFVSYIMRIAGAGRRFPYSADHATYINAAKREALGEDRRWLVTAERPDAYAPVSGDLICRGRGRASGLRYADLPTGGLFPAHCDIVVGIEPGRLAVVGGNVVDGVTLRFVPVGPDGRLAGADGAVLDPANPWMAVLRLQTADGPSG